MADSYDRYDNEGASGGFMMGLLTGTVLGAGLGMLLAPKAGSELRGSIGEQARHAGIVDGEAVAAGLLPQGAGEPALANPARPGDEQAAGFRDPTAGRQALEQRLVQPARRAVVDVLD